MEEQPPSPPMSLPMRMLNVLAAPGEVYEEVRRSGPCTANWLAPALLLIVVSWVASAVLFSQPNIQQQLRDITGQAVEKQVQKMKLPPEQAEKARDAAERYGAIGTKISMYAGPPVAGLVTPFFWGLILWGLARLFLKTPLTYMKAVEVVGLAAMISVLDAIVRTLLALAMGNLFASPSLALLVRHFDPQSPTHSLLAMVNIMTFWLLAVRSVGLSRLTGVTFVRAAAWVFGIWAAYTGFLIGVGALVNAVFNR